MAVPGVDERQGSVGTEAADPERDEAGATAQAREQGVSAPDEGGGRAIGVLVRRTVRVSELVMAARKPCPDASPKHTVARPSAAGMKSMRSPESRGPGSDACWKRYSPKVVRAGAYKSADGRGAAGVAV
ncbi:MAG: hypothetical protein ACFHWZ_16810 [Phycisphaerales bacterium]